VLFAPIKILSISAAVNQYTSVIVEPKQTEERRKKKI